MFDFKPFLNWWTEPWRTVWYFALKLEHLTAALFWYTLCVGFLDLRPSLGNALWAIVFVYLPYLSYIPYQLLKKKKRYITHFIGFWYDSVVYTGTWLFLLFGSYLLFRKPEPLGAWVVLVVGTSLTHFLMAARSSPRGIGLISAIPLRLTLQPWFKLLKEEEIRKYDHRFILQYMIDHQDKHPWDRSWSEELGERPSKTYRLTPLFLFIMALTAVMQQSWTA